jgi:hypothetical protein
MSDKPTERQYEGARDAGAQARRNGAREGDVPYRGHTEKVRVLREAWLLGFQAENAARKVRR